MTDQPEQVSGSGEQFVDGEVTAGALRVTIVDGPASTYPDQAAVPYDAGLPLTGHTPVLAVLRYDCAPGPVTTEGDYTMLVADQRGALCVHDKQLTESYEGTVPLLLLVLAVALFNLAATFGMKRREGA